jgi:hypothetical protein
LNEILYSAVLIAAVVELALYRIPRTRAWLAAALPYSFAHRAVRAEPVRVA